MSDRLIDVRVDGYSPHFVHAADRIWTETNCYVDLWVEVLHSLGHDPVPAAACAFSARFDGAQWTFLKFRPEDLLALYGIDVAEMNVWRRPVDHLEDNAAAGLLSTIEVDAFWLPDTEGTGYRESRSKTTIVPNLIDRDSGTLEYFHNSGYHVLTGEDFRGVFGLDEPVPTWPPYLEQVRLDAAQPQCDAFDTVVLRHLRMRAGSNPVRELGERVLADIDPIRTGGMDVFHPWTFGVLRQCGATAEFAADVSVYMDGRGYPGAAAAADGFRAVAEGAKSVQFRMARAARGRNVDPGDQLIAMAAAWEDAMATVVRAAGVR